MREITKVSPQGVPIIYIDAPGLARANFSPSPGTARGLETRVIPCDELTENERRVFGMDGAE